MNVEIRYLNRQVLKTNEATVFKITLITTCYTFSALVPAPGMTYVRCRGQVAEVCVWGTGTHEHSGGRLHHRITHSFTASICAFLLCEINTIFFVKGSEFREKGTKFWTIQQVEWLSVKSRWRKAGSSAHAVHSAPQP